MELTCNVNDPDCEDCNVQEQILVPQALLDPRVRVGMKLEELLGSQPPADEVSGQYYAVHLIQIFSGTNLCSIGFLFM